MIIIMNRRGDTKDSRRGSGGRAVRDYLLGKNNDRKYARLLKGDPALTTEIINGLEFKKLYTSGTLAFDYGEGDKLNEQDKQDIIESFERTLFPNLEPRQWSGYWVEHRDKVNESGERRLELNFVFASVELTSGKALPIYYHRNDVHLTNAWRDFTIATYDLVDPNSLNRKRALSTVKDLPKDVKELRQQLHEFITLEIEQGNINNRSEMVQALIESGIEVARQTDKSISIKNPNSTKNIRLSGAIYEREFTSEKLIKDHSGSTTEQSRQSTIDIGEARERLQYSIEKRSERLSQRFRTTENRHDERVHKIAETFSQERSELTEARNRFNSDTRYQTKPNPYETSNRKSNTYAASQHHERDAKDGYSRIWNHAGADAINATSSRLPTQNLATVFDDFIDDISNYWNSLRTNANERSKTRGLDSDSTTATTRYAKEHRARASQSGEHGLRPACERAESFSEAVAAEFNKYEQRTDSSITDTKSYARRSIEKYENKGFRGIGQASSRSIGVEQTSRLLNQAIGKIGRSNIKLEQQQITELKKDEIVKPIIEVVENPVGKGFKSKLRL